MTDILKNHAIAPIYLNPGDTLHVTYEDKKSVRNLTSFKLDTQKIINHVVIDSNKELHGMKDVLSVCLGSKEHSQEEIVDAAIEGNGYIRS